MAKNITKEAAPNKEAAQEERIAALQKLADELGCDDNEEKFNQNLERILKAPKPT